MPRYELTLAAEADLREVARYTIRQWGEKQAMRYVNTLAEAFPQDGTVPLAGAAE